MFNNSKGKTSLSLVCAFILIITACFIGVYGCITRSGDAMIQGFAYASLGAGLLGLRRVTPDKEIIKSETDGKEEKTN